MDGADPRAGLRLSRRAGQWPSLPRRCNKPGYPATIMFSFSEPIDFAG
jgi:hypothetical protein